MTAGSVPPPMSAISAGGSGPIRAGLSASSPVWAR